jgi:photosystem II stability/assembly factor-like uncharacterized protein
MKGLGVTVARKESLRIPGFLFAALVLFSKPVSAGGGGWTSRGLEGRAISSLVVDPSSPSRIYAAAGAEGIYRSTDGGESWTRVDIGQSVEKLAIDERDPDTLYAIAGPRFRQELFRSLDQGRSWAKVNLAGPVFSIAIDPKEPGVLHAGHDQAAVSSSLDGGATWSWSQFTYYCSFFCLEAITSLALDPSAPSTIYAGVDADYDYPGFGELFKSTDGGKTWKQSDAGLVLWSSVYSIAVDPNDSQRVFAGTSDYGGTNAATFLSLDAGLTWRPASLSASRAFAFDPWNPPVVYAGTDHEGVFRSTDRGTRWSPINSGLPNLKILSLAIDRTRGLLLAGTRDGIYSYPIADPRDAFIDVFEGDGATTGFLMFEAFGRFRLGTADGSGGKVLGSPHGPYTGWTPAAGSRGSDGATRVLWNSDDGSAALWLTRSGEVEAAFLYPAVAGWTARDVAAGADGSTRLLWTAGGGAISVWTVNSAGVRTGHFEYGPYSGWSAAAIADGPDGRTRILWNKIDGTIGLSFLDSLGRLDSSRYGPDAGWSSVDLAVGGDNHTRILRSHEDGRIAVWRIDEAGTPVSFGTIYAAPPGFVAARLSAGSDGLTRVLWRDPNGLAIVWLLTADGRYQSSFPLN